MICVLVFQDEGNNTMRDRIKELEDERGRLHRTNAAQQMQIDKFKKIAEDAKSKSDSSESQLAGLRKVRVVPLCKIN